MSELREVLAAHHVVVSGTGHGWFVLCACGHREPGVDRGPHLADAVTAWIGARLAEVHEDVAAAIDSRPDCVHEDEVNSRGWECQPCTTDTSLWVVAAALEATAGFEGSLAGEQAQSDLGGRE